MTDVGSQGIRGKRKTTYVAGAIVVLIVAAALAMTSFVTGAPTILWLALLLVAVAIVLIIVGKRVRRSPPSHGDHPRLTHDEDHPKDKEMP